jgi:pimeloyl-ACP methyl ester carboxylesterase
MAKRVQPGKPEAAAPPAPPRRPRVRASFDAAGPKDAHPIVFAHGIRVTRKQWLPQMRDLRREYRVIALDLPGHGALAGAAFSLDAAARRLREVVDEQAGGRALVAGLSLGGYVAIEFARRWPERASGLVLTGCSANPRGVLSVLPPTLALFQRAVGDRWLTFFNEINFRLRYGEAMAEQQIEAGFFFKGTQEALRQLRGKDFRRALSAYPGPVLLLNGERDTLYRLAELGFLASTPDARLQLVRGAGHVANLEEPAAYTRALRRFARCIDW